MDLRADLTLFAHIVSRPEPELDLAEAALLIAEPEYPGLDIVRYVGLLDELGAEARDRLARAAHHESESELALRRVLRLLYDERGFRGNAADYYDPRNSFLNEVLDRRTGIPITLAVVLLEVCRRAGLSARGVSFPGHFLVRAPGAPGNGPLFVDPFDGRLLSPADLRALHARSTGEERDPDPRLLEPTTKSQLLLRMLNNLRAIYANRSDRERLRGVLERIQVLAPSEELARQLEQLGGEHVSPPAGPRVIN
jgi:regulator of sirC expression with transglutaminase-like and TPR domain